MHTDASDERFSKYQLIRQLGSGGMGVVYLAHDTTLNRDVAIKFVSPDRLSEPGAEQRLVREAQAAAGLDHPCICPVYDVQVEPDGRTYIVMQYVDGETLADRLRRGPLEVRHALTLAADIAEALAAAHAHGVVHRDLKPQNIIVTPSGRPKLLDFGIAKVHVPAEGDESQTLTVTSLTGTNELLGTPAYMSPEQVLRKPLDGRSDLFSLGAILYECLTGEAAFRSPTNVETWGRVVHVDPPPPSSIRPELTDAHDELCRRLLAKDPADRFQSADELLGALRLLVPGTRRDASTRDSESRSIADWLKAHRRLAVAAAVLIAAASFVVWRITRPAPLPEPPKAARSWYEKGTEHIREGAYYSAQQALREAVGIFPQYPQAYARLAEAQSELDEEAGAQKALLQVSTIVRDPSQLPDDEGIRLTAIRALVLRDLPAALSAYSTLSLKRPKDRGAWLDLARAREAAGLRADARTAYAQALQLDSQYAAAHLRLGALAAQEARRDEALKEFQEAERLYRAASDSEGETEALLERATFLNGLGELPQARTALERAAQIAKQTGNQFQQIRAALILSSIVASEGKFGESRAMAEDAVSTALQNRLETVAADGLIELGTSLMRSDDPAGAKTQLQKAIDLANRRGAHRVAARAKLQLASVFLTSLQPRDALNLAEGLFKYLHDRQFRRYELVALSIASRAHEDLGEYGPARDIAKNVLSVAEALKDESEVALALEALAGQSAATGQLPDALALRERLEGIHRRQRDTATLAYDLANRAELLIRLGKGAAAEAPLGEIETGIAAKVDAFVARAGRTKVLRALRDTVDQRFASAAVLCQQVLDTARAAKTVNSTSRLAGVLCAHAHARLGDRSIPRDELTARDDNVTLLVRHELQYWRAATWLALGDTAAALNEVTAGVRDLEKAPSDENEWRLAAIGAVAARRLHDTETADRLTARARGALGRLRTAWKDMAADYERRPDLAERIRDAGLGQP